MKPVEHKPAWLREFIPNGNMGKLDVCMCEGCGRYVIRQQLGVWDYYDPGIIQDDDLIVAIILRRALARIRWDNTFRQPVLYTVSGTAGLKADGQYLAEHDCRLARITDRAFKPPRRERTPGKPMFDAKLSKADVAEFARLWHMPLAALRAEVRARPPTLL
ncbi:hypothetical protein BBIA_0626 [Bifidobacterium biavatii DSM 23969]|uniref:Uncharacterized protein n=2 Tax=Bifidobacterium biavatii TaxID=762212 RepID=A0A086ZYW3_9BIFI|nr:hypothetical protein BBIA_0626 [Bifidobacterium biavatii DSM 23969]